ncbi:hypothetical protein GOV05_01665 [Candidatus Woesearchaeota archaeon]|nr:hypothetical protein [Candidatus Woesearchaeota archaeon]
MVFGRKKKLRRLLSELKTDAAVAEFVSKNIAYQYGEEVVQRAIQGMLSEDKVIKAADFANRQGADELAINLYLNAGKPVEASEIAQHIGEPVRAVKILEDANKLGPAGDVAFKHGHHIKGLELYLRAKEDHRAISRLKREGLLENEIFEDMIYDCIEERSQEKDIIGAAKLAREAGIHDIANHFYTVQVNQLVEEKELKAAIKLADEQGLEEKVSEVSKLFLQRQKNEIKHNIATGDLSFAGALAYGVGLIDWAVHLYREDGNIENALKIVDEHEMHDVKLEILLEENEILEAARHAKKIGEKEIANELYDEIIKSEPDYHKLLQITFEAGEKGLTNQLVDTLIRKPEELSDERLRDLANKAEALGRNNDYLRLTLRRSHQNNNGRNEKFIDWLATNLARDTKRPLIAIKMFDLAGEYFHAGDIAQKSDMPNTAMRMFEKGNYFIFAKRVAEEHGLSSKAREYNFLSKEHARLSTRRFGC